MNESIYSLVETMKKNFVTGVVKTGKYVDLNVNDHFEKVHAYLNSKHISGDTDSLGREKPFEQVVIPAVNVWYRATDIDRADIRLKAKKTKDVMSTFIANVHLDHYMKRENFGAFLNDWGYNLAAYGSIVTKFVDTGDRLHTMVIPWSRIICDTIDFENNPKIERLYLTKSQLKARKEYNQEVVDSLIEAQGVSRRLKDGSQQDNNANFIEVYEVHGELPLSYLTGREEDDDIYTQQMHVISYMTAQDGSELEFSLYAGKEEKDPYVLSALIKEDGCIVARGAVSSLFDVQWMVNHTAKLIKDQLDVAAKLLFQTSDPSFVGQNAISSLEVGDILLHAPNQPLTGLNNAAHDIGSLQSFSNQFKSSGKETTSTPDAITGATMPSGTAYRQVAVLNQEAHSLFEIMTENKALELERMMRVHIIPYIKKQMSSTEEISAVLDTYNLSKVDEEYINIKSNEIRNESLKKQILSGTIAEDVNIDEIKAGVRSGLAKLGSQRFFVPSENKDVKWSDVLKDYEWEVEIEITNESTNKEATLTTLTTLLQTIASNPAILQDKRAKVLFTKIVEATGVISPIELDVVDDQSAMQEKTNQESNQQQNKQLPMPQATQQPISGT